MVVVLLCGGAVWLTSDETYCFLLLFPPNVTRGAAHAHLVAAGAQLLKWFSGVGPFPQLLSHVFFIIHTTLILQSFLHIIFFTFLKHVGQRGFQ